MSGGYTYFTAVFLQADVHDEVDNEEGMVEEDLEEHDDPNYVAPNTEPRKAKYIQASPEDSYNDDLVPEHIQQEEHDDPDYLGPFGWYFDGVEVDNRDYEDPGAEIEAHEKWWNGEEDNGEN